MLIDIAFFPTAKTAIFTLGVERTEQMKRGNAMLSVEIAPRTPYVEGADIPQKAKRQTARAY